MNDAEAGSIGKLLAEVSAEIADMRKSHASDIARAVAKERAAVVAHLRERAIHGAGNILPVEDACTILADLFERGEHRREVSDADR